MSDLDNELHRMIRSAADQIAIPPSPVGQVMSRGQTRHRRQWVLTVLVVVVFAAAGLAALSARGGGRHTTHVASTGAPAALQWKVVDTAATLGYETSLTPGGASALYAVSTAPGVANTSSPNMTATIYRSLDGITWSPVAGPAGLALSDLSAIGNRVYAVGTGTATAAVATSTDGSTWQRSALNLDLASILTKATSDGSVDVNVAAGPAGVLATVTVNATLDLAKVLPAGAPTPSSWAATAQGAELLKGTCPGAPIVPKVARPGVAFQVSGGSQAEPPGDPVLCYSPAGAGPVPGPYWDVVSSGALGPVDASYTWAQLGVSGNTERAVLDEPFGFLSTDGTTFHPVALPGRPGAGEPQIVAGPTGFGFVGADQPARVDAQTYAFWQSTDGTNWVKAPPLARTDNSIELRAGVLDDHYAVAQDSPAGPELEILVGDQWNVTNLDQVAGLAASTGRATTIKAAFGPLGVAVVLDSPGITPDVLYSPDGVSWSSRSLNAIAGGPLGEPNVVVVTASQVIVVAPRATGSNPPPSLTLVGTPG